MARADLVLSLALASTLGVEASALALCQTPGDPDCVDRAADFRGTVDFFATGASFTFDDDLDDRPDGLLQLASVNVPQRRIPARAKLVQAYLYFGGSLYADNDGNDTPDQEVELKVPGNDRFVTVRGDTLHQSGAIPGFPEVTLYSVRADITSILRDAGGQMVGTYQVQGFAADIFDGPNEHTAANASFSIILIFEEERLPPRSIVLFDGMQEVLGSTVTLPLSGFIVSQVPSGSLTFYAQEGDCNPGPESCANGNNLSGLERVRVIGAEPSRTLVVSDGINPSNDVFNRTINTVDPPLVDVPGTDIDAFDITPVLRAGDEAVTVEVTSPQPRNGFSGELVGLVYVIVGIDVFAPELRLDSQIRIRTERGERLEAYYPGDPLRITYALSNTGNLPGTEVAFSTDLPANATNFLVLREPDGATVNVDPTGGAHGKGRIEVDGVAVRNGEVNDLVLLVETECPLPGGGTFEISADVGAAKEQSTPFTMTASTTLLARSICGPRFYLYGGGGCRDAGGRGPLSGVALGLLSLGLGWLLRRRPRAWGLVWLLLPLTQTACGEEGDTAPDRAPPAARGVGCPGQEGMIVIPSIRGEPPYCIDQYEASLGPGLVGNVEQPEDGDGSTTAAAVSARFVQPARGLSWFQAKAACANAGKRLCKPTEWTTACRGDEDLTYPYGDEYQASTCNGFDAIRRAPVETGAMIVGESDTEGGALTAGGCVSKHGAYDLSGNLLEWNDGRYLEGSRRGLAGGGFRSNRSGLRCVTDDNYALPGDANDAHGFRCCLDFPR